MQGNLAGSTLIQFCNDFLGSSEEIVSDVEYIDLSHAVEGCLYQDCSSSAAGTEQSHLLPMMSTPFSATALMKPTPSVV